MLYLKLWKQSKQNNSSSYIFYLHFKSYFLLWRLQLQILALLEEYVKSYTITMLFLYLMLYTYQYLNKIKIFLMQLFSLAIHFISMFNKVNHLLFAQSATKRFLVYLNLRKSNSYQRYPFRMFGILATLCPIFKMISL